MTLLCAEYRVFMPQHRRARYTQDGKYAVLAGLLLLAVVGILLIVSTTPHR